MRFDKPPSPPTEAWPEKKRTHTPPMPSPSPKNLKDGAACDVIAGTHAGKSGRVQDINTSKTGAVTITVLQANGVRFKTLAKNVQIK